MALASAVRIDRAGGDTLLATTASTARWLAGDAGVLTARRTGHRVGLVAACAERIGRLLDDPGLYEGLRLRGRQIVEEEFLLDRAIDAVDRHLRQAVAERNASPGWS